jgi:hypothetical protein
VKSESELKADMIALFTTLLLLAQPAPLTLDQIRADANPEHRAHSAIGYAVAAERNAEAAYNKGEMAAVATELKNMAEAIELARQSLEQTGKSAMRHPGPYKFGELRTQEMLVRLGDLEHKMDSDERAVLQAPLAKVQEVHDAWFDGIMSKKK